MMFAFGFTLIFIIHQGRRQSNIFCLNFWDEELILFTLFYTSQIMSSSYSDRRSRRNTIMLKAIKNGSWIVPWDNGLENKNSFIGIYLEVMSSIFWAKFSEKKSDVSMGDFTKNTFLRFHKKYIFEKSKWTPSIQKRTCKKHSLNTN